MVPSHPSARPGRDVGRYALLDNPVEIQGFAAFDELMGCSDK